MASSALQELEVLKMALNIEDEKLRIKWLVKLTSLENKKKLLGSIKNENILLDYIVNNKGNSDIETFVFENCFMHEEYKFRYIFSSIIDGYIPPIYFISHLKSDNFIVPVLKLLVDECYASNYITLALLAIKSDDEFFKHFRPYSHLVYPTARVELLKRRNDAKKINIIKNEEGNTQYKLDLICSLEDDEVKLTFLSSFDGDDLVEVAKSCTTDAVKMLIFNKISDSYDKLQVALLFKSDYFRRQALQELPLEERAKLVCALDLDDEKVEYLKSNLFTLGEKTDIVLSFKSPKLKSGLLKKMYKINASSMYDENFHMAHIMVDAGVDALSSDMTFGVELEATGYLGNVLSGIGGKLLGKWNVKEENSIGNGVEFSSPILHYRDKDLNQVYNACSFAKSNKLYTNDSCGGHIHFGSNYLDTVDAWFMFYYLYTSCEKIFYIISNEPGKPIRDGVYTYASSIKEKSATFFNGTFDDRSVPNFIDNLKSIFASHYDGVNVSNINVRMDTIEFRVPNGTLNADAVVQNVLLFGNLLRSAKMLSRLPMKKDAYNLIHQLGSDKIEDRVKFETLMKLLFREESMRKVFRKRFKANIKLYDESPKEYIDVKDKKMRLSTDKRKM